MALKREKPTEFSKELDDFRKYLLIDENEDAKRQHLFPLFKKLYKEKFRTESAAGGADGYAEGQILIECKGDYSQWLEGFYQALHYHKAKGLAYNSIMVIAHKFVAIWKVNKLPEYAAILALRADAHKAPNEIGRENARKTQKASKVEIRNAAFYWLEPRDLEGDIFSGARNLITEVYEVKKILSSLDSDRLQINTHNFISAIERMKSFFEQPIDAVHGFYTIIAYWDITSTVSANDAGDEIRVIGFKGNKFSDAISIAPRYFKDFKRFVETQYIFTNEGSGLTVDYYFSRFDEVMAVIDPQYVKQHGIFFTDANLSKFALWFAKHHFPGNINSDYVVFDPAGGSGNLVSSWKGKIKHKIVSELQPDLLRIIERRMKADPFEVESGFSIIPKTSEGHGLNFLDSNARDYMQEITKELALKNISIDKPLAFLLNPPYKNTDENVSEREAKEASYGIDPSIIELTGEDAGKERYLAFLGQILNISKEQNAANKKLHPVVMIFTPTSWLIPRPTYRNFRSIWDQYFKYHSGFMITSNDFFKIDGKWPLAFTIWNFDPSDPEYLSLPTDELANWNGTPTIRTNNVEVFDLTHLKRPDLNIAWNEDEIFLNLKLSKILENTKLIRLDNSRGDIKKGIPSVNLDGNLIKQTRFNIYRTRTKEEKAKRIVSGFPLNDTRHERLKVPYGYSDGIFIGFMDDCTPIRLRIDALKRMSNIPDRVWLYLDNRMIQINLVKIFSGSPDKYSYCAHDLESGKFFFTWFSTAKSLVGGYPIWSNQYSIWPPKILPALENEWYSLCFAFVLAENRCVVTKFEKDNPVEGAPEVFVDNPLCPTNKDSFWSTTLAPFINTADAVNRKNTKAPKQSNALSLTSKITELYKHWNYKYCKGQFLYNVGLQDEAYFQYFSYADFLTPHSGLIQIRKYAEIEGLKDLQDLFGEINELTKKVKEDIYRMLTVDFGYFE